MVSGSRVADHGAARPGHRGGRSGRAGESSPALDVDALLDDRGTRIIVCCGAGGVGKTTTAAALGLRAAERGRRAVVLTIDPARRLAQSLGLAELDNSPRVVPGVDRSSGGSLDAMMLDMKRTFDEVVQAHAKPEKAEQILANPFYQALSSSFAGTQEYMAMEKLGQLHDRRDEAGRPFWDLVVVDTPPSRSALDFLDAPERLGSFLDGRFIRLMMAPAKAGGRAYLRFVQAGMSATASALSKILGAQMLHDVQTLVAALDTVFGGFRERATHTYALLQDEGTAFVVVASPERDALREAGYFIDRLAADGMPLAGVVVNRMARVEVSLSADAADRAADRLEAVPESDEVRRLAAALLRLQAMQDEVTTRQQAATRHLAEGHPGVPMVQVPSAAVDVHDLGALRRIGVDLAAGAGA
ncbi:arsenite efflux ATP-binding protein ArsA [Austwickia chelonae]|uniref:ArsA family ATPase n=1 Tax=Austwickia chelonae TaxID=100225 RepID=UPI0008CD1B6C|nr:ArsA family ATPase [Austwickia chelonae]SEW33607.1 arsenite efflux ATP-binding protein ArsA [Austwickia chelonae]